MPASQGGGGENGGGAEGGTEGGTEGGGGSGGGGEHSPSNVQTLERAAKSTSPVFVFQVMEYAPLKVYNEPAEIIIWHPYGYH
jgi:hypothetical protein